MASTTPRARSTANGQLDLVQDNDGDHHHHVDHDVHPKHAPPPSVPRRAERDWPRAGRRSPTIHRRPRRPPWAPDSATAAARAALRAKGLGGCQSRLRSASASMRAAHDTNPDPGRAPGPPRPCAGNRPDPVHSSGRPHYPAKIKPPGRPIPGVHHNAPSAPSLSSPPSPVSAPKDPQTVIGGGCPNRTAPAISGPLTIGSTMVIDDVGCFTGQSGFGVMFFGTRLPQNQWITIQLSGLDHRHRTMRHRAPAGGRDPRWPRHRLASVDPERPPTPRPEPEPADVLHRVWLRWLLRCADAGDRADDRLAGRASSRVTRLGHAPPSAPGSPHRGPPPRASERAVGA